ncbi:hypothetical protein MHYP_G00198150 [Metynnis hypsauchen]
MSRALCSVLSPRGSPIQLTSSTALCPGASFTLRVLQRVLVGRARVGTQRVALQTGAAAAERADSDTYR